MMKVVVPALDQMVLDRVCGIDEANCIIVTMRVPIDMAHSLGLLLTTAAAAVSPTLAFDGYQPPSPLSLHQPLPYPSTTFHHVTSPQNIPLNQVQPTPSTTVAPSSCTVVPPPPPSLSGSESPGASFYGGTLSPMHQITKAIGGMSTGSSGSSNSGSNNSGGGGSITRGTSHVADRMAAAAATSSSPSAEQPLDLSMDVSCGGPPNDNVSNVLYEQQHQQQFVRGMPTPPPTSATANLCIIQEEIQARGTPGANQAEPMLADCVSVSGC